jgi:hypothetical protein
MNLVEGICHFDSLISAISIAWRDFLLHMRIRVKNENEMRNMRSAPKYVTCRVMSFSATRRACRDVA